MKPLRTLLLAAPAALALGVLSFPATGETPAPSWLADGQFRWTVGAPVAGA